MSLPMAMSAFGLLLLPSLARATEGVPEIAGFPSPAPGPSLGFWLSVAAIGFVVLSAMYAYIFRVVCRKVLKPNRDFSLMQGTVFFAWAPLVWSVVCMGLAYSLGAYDVPVLARTATFITITTTGTAWFARRFLLHAGAATASYRRILGITAITFAIAGGLFNILAAILLALT